MAMIFMLVMMVALLNNQNYPSTHAIALTPRNDLNQLIKGMGNMYSGAKKDWHLYYIITIEMRSL